MTFEAREFRRITDSTGTLVVIESGVDVPFLFSTIDVLDVTEADTAVGDGYPYLLFSVDGRVMVRSEGSRAVLDSPNDVVVGDGTLPVTVSALGEKGRCVVVSSRPSTHQPEHRGNRAPAPERVAATVVSNGDSHQSAHSWAPACPFPVKRIYYTHSVQPGMPRGGHAHWELEQVLVSVNGTIELALEQSGVQTAVELSDPGTGVLITPVTWRDIQFSRGACLLVLASDHYREADYIRDYEVFSGL